MAEQVQDIVWRVRQLVHDSAGARWTDDEMIRWVNDGLREIVLLKPSSNAQRKTLQLVAGTVQELPVGSLQLIRITHNTSGSAIRLVDQDRLDATAPNWRIEAEAAQVVHYMYSDEAPEEYQVYPPNNGVGSVEASVAMQPTEVTAMGNPNPLNDIYIPALTDYLIYRAYSKHSKHAGNEQRAMNAYSRFAQALGVRRTNEIEGDPNLTNKDARGIE